MTKRRGDLVQVLKNLTLDRLINLYEGKVVHDRVNIQRHFDAPADYERELAKDKMILGALKCAKLYGYTGEE